MRKIYAGAFYRKSLLFLFLPLFFAGKLYAQIDYPIGTGSTGNANTTYPCPFQDFYEGSRMQYLYRASELTAAGMTAGNITAIKYNVLSLATSANSFFAIEGFTVKIGTTSTTSLSATSWETVNTTVYGPVNYMATLGINTLTFSSPFLWNGNDNIVIEVCGGDPNTTSAVFYTGNPAVPWTTGLSFNGSHSYRADNLDNLCGTATTTNTGDQTTRPNITFFAAAAGPCTNPPAAGTPTPSSNPVCMGSNFNVGLIGGTVGTGQTYQWQSSPDNAVWTDIPGATSGSLSTSQTANTYYRCIVTCGVSSTSASVLVNTIICYCPSIPTQAADEEIFSVMVNGATNAFDCNTVAPGAGSILNRYSNFYPLGPLTALIPGTSVPFSIQEDECDGATYFNNGCAVWIDFNRDGDFLDAGEQVYVESAVTVSPRTIAGSIAIPITALPGLTGMRIIVAEGNSGTGLTPCLAYGYGETEDYLVNILPLTPCTSPPTAGTSTVTPGSVCGGIPVNLGLTGTSYGSGQTYQWESATTLAGTYTSIGTASISPYYTTVAPNVSTYYRCAVTCSGNTTYSTPVQLIVNASTPDPSIAATPTGNVCNGITVDLTTPTCLGCSYAWSTGASTNNITVSTAGLYTVTVSNSCGAKAISKEVIVDPSPSLSISAGTILCLGTSAPIEANGASTYSWSPATGLNTTTGPSVIASPTVTTTYTVTGSIGTCSKTLSVTIEVNPVPVAPAITATGGAAATTFCLGGNVVLNSSSATGNQWYKDGTIIAGATNQTYTATESGTYTAKITSNSCTSDASAGTVVTVNDIPVQPAITQVGNALQSSAASGNQWLLNGAAIAGATGQTYSPTTSGQYTVQVTTSGCTGIASAVFNFTITATSDPVLDKKLTIAPNPVRDNLLIKYNGNGAKFSVLLFTTNGSMLHRGSFTTNYQLDMRKYSAGLYIVRVVNERTGEKVQRMIVKQ